MRVRKATKEDRHAIATCIAQGFERDFSLLCRDMERVANAIHSGIQIDRFYVAEVEDQIVGVMGISDCYGRAMMTDVRSYQKHFGKVKGALAKWILKGEFEAPLPYPATTGFVEFVSVKNEARRKRVASTMIQESMQMSGYREFLLDVVSSNTPAMECYRKLGFVECKRMEKKCSRQKNDVAKILMRYVKEDAAEERDEPAS